ncbi:MULTISPECIES: alpha/beta hydrolase family protein [Rufibacter]|uniref:Pimeloyl-ACP methyl ester carboxylesterase n=1 Tax=Rufibacter quisquiliarum TaxID=1549639 RepID=A0A839GRG8_9BACT|nr:MULTISPECIES: alpha/beta fold hydrolase [Rufibacter]MBA9076431.1 pimeloyl-ACP methyl ester carboxylesterase [Rufibacter quisquiliarum]
MLTRADFLLSSAHGRYFSVDARWLQDGQPKPVAVFVHGFKGFKDWGHFNLLADYFARHGFVFVKLNLSHNGVEPGGDDLTNLEAFGNNNFCIELDDVKTVLDALQTGSAEIPAQEMAPEYTFLIGHSRGGGLVLLKAAEDARVTGVATWAAISDIDRRWFPEMMEQWQRDGVQYITNARTGQQMPLYYQLVENFQANRQRLDIPKAVEKLQIPLLLIHGEADETLPVQMAHDLHAQNPFAELYLIPAGDHSFGGRHPYDSAELPALAKAAADKTIQFFQEAIERLP